MTALKVMAARIRAFVARGRGEAALDEDIQAHLELLALEHVRRGLSPADARDAARRDFGGVEQMKEAHRDQRGLPLVESLLQDVRYAFRMYKRSPGFTLVAVVTIALGVFGPTLTFTMAKAWILEPLPFERPDGLVDLRNLDQRSGNTSSVTAADLLDWQRGALAFEEIAGYTFSNARLTGRDQTERVRGARVTPGFFRVLGVRARRGLLFDEAAPDSDVRKLVVISHALWRDHFREDEAAIGGSLRLDGEDHTVIGVLADSFQFTLLGRCDVWRPLVFTPEQASDRRSGTLTGLGRLRRGRTLDEARHELTQLAARLAAAHPDTNARRSVRVIRLADEIRVHHDLGFIVPMMFAMVVCVLLIACVNVTNVMLARTSTRRQELAVRLALGASRARIVRQWLVEHVMLFVGASLIGAALAVVGADWITQSIPVENRQYLRNFAALPVDRVVVLFAVAVGALCGVAFGWFPAWTGTRADVNADLRDGSARTTAGRAGSRLRAALVVAEVALALAVLINVGLLVASVRNIRRVDVGFDPRQLLTFQLSLDPQQYRTPAERLGFYERLTAALAGRPGVTAAAAGSLVPFGNTGNRAEFFREGSPETPPAETPRVFLNQVTGEYGSALRLRLLAGRLLSQDDGADSPRVAMINQTLASRHFPGQDPLGSRVRLARGGGEPWTVVGVVQDVKVFENTEPAQPQVYVPFAQQPRAAMTVVVRTSGDPGALAAATRGAVAAIDPAEPVVDVVSMENRILRVTSAFQTVSTFVIFVGALTLLLAGIGVYGVISYSFAQRTREIGIRMALGARRADVGGLVLRQLRGFLLASLLPGLLLAWGLSQALKGMLFGVTATDWRLYGSMALLLGAVALVAALVPARRAVAIDPMKALHHE